MLTLLIVHLLLLLQALILFLGLIHLISALQSLFGGAPFVPLEYEVGQGMLKAAKPRKGETIYDLGCGDGRQLIMAALAYPVRCIGVDISWAPLLKGWLLIWLLRLHRNVTLRWKRLENQPLTDANIVFLYLFPSLLRKLRPKLETELPPGTRILSARYPIPDWPPTKTITTHKHPIYLYQR